MITRSIFSPSERPKVLITGGRAPAALELARLLSAAGCEVYAAESLRHHLCRVSRAVTRSYTVPAPARDTEGFLSALEEIVRRERIEWLIPTCEETFYVSAGLERLGRLCRVFTAPLEQLRRLHSKWEFIRLAEGAGFAVPQTRYIRTPGEMESFAQAGLREPIFADGCVLKPEFSRFASKVCRISPAQREAGAAERLFFVARKREEPAPKALLQLDKKSYPWVAQQWIRGRSLCTYSIVHEGRLAAHAAYAVSYTVRGGACVYFEPLAHPRLLEWVRGFVRSERFTGQIAFDFIEAADGTLYPIECNPRATSGIHLFRPQDGLASALLQPEALNREIIEPQAGARGMLAVPMLAYGLGGTRSWHGFATWLRQYAAARDVVFRWTDPGPCWEQLRLLRELRSAAAAMGRTVMEASTADIEWNGGGL